MNNEVIHPAVRVGHVHLRVADLDRALAFYRDALGFGVTADARPAGIDMVLLAAGDYHHHTASTRSTARARRRRPQGTPVSTTSRFCTPTGASSAAP
jgi:catechol 2,3-dioxygenase